MKTQVILMRTMSIKALTNNVQGVQELQGHHIKSALQQQTQLHLI